jgi:hypothetical protein
VALQKDKKLSHGLVDSVAAALVPQAAGYLDPNMEEALLWIPIDLRDSIGSQLKHYAETLRAIQDWLYRLNTGHTAARPSAHNVWRDTYVFLLARHFGRNVAQIGDAEFSSQPKASRQRLVHQILKRVEKALDQRWGDHLVPRAK